MGEYRVLYISSSIGLGHVVKDLAIVHKLRSMNQGVEVVWIATDPATSYLEAKGESLHPLYRQFKSYSAFAEKSTRKSGLNLTRYVLGSLRGWMKNLKVLRKILKEEHYNILVGNETYEILIGLKFKMIRIKIPFVIIYDFLGLDSMTKSPFERTVNYILNWIWSGDHKFFAPANRDALFIGESEDIPESRFGFMLPHRREYAMTNYKFIGYIVRFDPLDFMDKLGIRKRLGYAENPLIICAIGGTAIGKDLLKLCIKAYPILKSKVDNLIMILVAGPRMDQSDIEILPGIEIKGFIPDLYQHFAACDLAVVQGGFSSTLELTTLKRPFIYFPIEGHSEQEFVSKRLDRHQAGIRMNYSKTTPEKLAGQILAHMGQPVRFKTLDTKGAENAANIINRHLTIAGQGTS